MITQAEIQQYLDRATNGVALIAVHESGALRALGSALAERLAVARLARTAGELIRDQIDLLPESRTRFRRDQQVRRQLWRGLLRDLSAPIQKVA
ncbi:MAG: hypothetical protein ACRETM_12465 [Stenotrophobium sp.]